MPATTVIMQVVDNLGQAAWLEERDAFGHRRCAEVGAQPAEDFAPFQPGEIEITLRHGGQVVGAVDYLERAPGGDLVAVAVLGCDVEQVEDLYVSAEINRVGDSYELVRLAIVGATSGVAAKPLIVLPGDYRKSADRGYWSRPPEVIVRAAEMVPSWLRWQRPAALPIFRPPTWEERLIKSAPTAGTRVPAAPVDQRAAAGSRPRDCGPLEYGPRGSILSVR